VNDDLADALNREHLARVIDVSDPELMPADDPYLERQKHSAITRCGGWLFACRNLERIVRIAADNLAAL
jgi:phosphoglycerate dehydrogenase-like enzyme